MGIARSWTAISALALDKSQLKSTSISAALSPPDKEFIHFHFSFNLSLQGSTLSVTLWIIFHQSEGHVYKQARGSLDCFLRYLETNPLWCPVHLLANAIHFHFS